jgi:4-amino-4-deoxy-L-arabinose transferase-like glycosyltransferase
VTLASGLRFVLLGRNSFWYDEAWVASLMQLGWQEIAPILAGTDVHPPLYFYLMKAWVGLAGTTEVALRLPSVFASVLSVLLTYFVMRRLAPAPVSLLGAFLVSLSPFDVMAGREARMYAVLEVLALGATLAVTLSVERGGGVRWAGYGTLAAAVAYTHYLGIIVLAAHGLWIAFFERRHLRAWVLAMSGAMLLYAPWISSLWHQAVTNEYHETWYRHAVGSSDLAALLGLFAFGGSLFGMAGYFLGGTLEPVKQWLVVLPFLVVFWRGVAALSADRRGLGLLGFCLALPIGVALLISLIKPIFYARWFSFLLPFYAMFVALGLAELAGRVRASHQVVLAGLTAGILSCSMPVFVRYYFDPGFRPYQWRAAAALVRAEAQPQDAIVYVHSASAVAFLYYFHERHPSLILTPTEALGAAAFPGFTAVQARELAGRYPRVWLIATVAFNAPMRQRLLPALRSAFQFGGVHDFRGVWVTRHEAKP